MLDLNLIQKIIVWAPPIVFAITLHEAAHGWMAGRLGDPTARMLGRVTLNPIRHIDPLGTIIIPGVLLLVGGFLFGWAKPVPITTQNFRRPRQDMAIVGAAGPMANLLMAIFWALVMRVGTLMLGHFGQIGPMLLLMGVAGIYINIILMLLNLLPLPPLDGGRVLSGLLPGRYAVILDRIEPYGFIILIVLIVTHILGYILGPPVYAMLQGMFVLGGAGWNTGITWLNQIL